MTQVLRIRGSGVRISPSAPCPPSQPFTHHRLPSRRHARKPHFIRLTCIAGDRFPSRAGCRQNAPLTVPRFELEAPQRPKPPFRAEIRPAESPLEIRTPDPREEPSGVNE